MTDIPKTRFPDTTLGLLRDGYEYISSRCRRYHSDLFETRLLGQRVICMTGADAAALLYDSERFQRAGAIPLRIQRTLTGEGGVQGLDADAHRRRKAMFMSLMARPRLVDLNNGLAYEWQTALVRWSATDRVVLFPEIEALLCRAACDWSGIPASDDEIRERARDFGSMVDGFGAVGPRWHRARAARRRSEAWARRIIEQVRSGELTPRADAAAYVIAHHKDVDGDLLPVRIAAVELLNVLRPIVAIATYVSFLALALHDHPEYRNLLQESDWLLEPFVQEVRRYYPFTPFVGGVVKQDFDWRGVRFPKGRLALLDAYGINHDPRLWDAPEQFRPERFAEREPGPFEFVPQGGGDHAGGHRCAGEWLTIEVMQLALRFLTRHMAYDVPPQDLSVDLSRIPTRPKSGFIMRDVRPLAARRRQRPAYTADEAHQLPRSSRADERALHLVNF